MPGRRLRRTLYSSALLATLLLTNGHTGWAQVRATLSGRVEDPSGNTVPDATVTVTSTETGAKRMVTTDAAGTYRVLSLAVGGYEIKAEKPGFKTALRQGISLAVGQEAVINLRLEVGDVVQEVTVTAEAPIVNTTTASVSGLVGERQVKDLPLNGRSFDNLITLNPGTVNYTGMRSDPSAGSGSGNSFSVAGRRPSENLYLLNGIEYTGASNAGITPGGVSGQLLGIDAVREFNVVSGTYSAEYGKRSGGQVNVVTQSGTNQLHGTIFEFLRNSALDARNFFDYGIDERIPAFRRNQFGGALGGPLKRDKLFAFGNFEGFRQRLGLSNVTIVPDLNARQGILPNDQGVLAQAAGLNSAMLPYMAFWPLPNGPSLGRGLALSYSSPKQSINEDFGTTRLDYTRSDKDSFSGSFTVDVGDNLTPQANPLFGSTIHLNSQVASLQETHIFSPQFLNTARVGYSRAEFASNQPPLVPFPAALSLVVGRIPGRMTVSGMTSAGTGFTPYTRSNRTLFTYADDVQLVKGKHQINIGAWFQRLRLNELQANFQAGNVGFNSLALFFQGRAASFTAGLTPTPLGWRAWEGAWYVQDSVNVRENLQVRLGLREEFATRWTEHHGRASNYVFGPNGALLSDPRVASSGFTENNAKALWSPRVGLAWDPFGQGKTSVRAAFGIHYSFMETPGFMLDKTYPFNPVTSFQNVLIPTVVPLVPGTKPLPPCSGSVPQPCGTYGPWSMQSDLETPTVISWNFGIEQQLTASMALHLGYLGSRGYHGIIFADANSIAPARCTDAAGCRSGGVGSTVGTVPNGAEYIPVTTLPNPFLGAANFWFSEGNASYNAFQIDLSKRLNKGLQFRTNYTFAKGLDTLAEIAGSQAANEAQSIMNPYDIRRDWGPSASSVRHQFSGNISYQLPFGSNQPILSTAGSVIGYFVSGWQVNAIITALSGFPVTAQVGFNRSGAAFGANGERPDLNPAFTGPVVLGRVERWFDVNAFRLQTPGTYGNAGRGLFTGPRLTTSDVSVSKNTPIGEKTNLQFRAEVFNILNHANFGNPNSTAFTAAGVNASAGLITRTITTSRQIQFGLKYIF
jgi:hypothetical protein